MCGCVRIASRARRSRSSAALGNTRSAPPRPNLRSGEVTTNAAKIARADLPGPMGEMGNAEIQDWELPDAGEQVRRLGGMFVPSPSLSALLQGPDHRFVLTNPAYQQLIGRRDVIGLTVREAILEAERQGFTALLDTVFATGEAFVGKDVEIILQRSTGGPAEKRYLDFVYQPIKDEKGAVTSIFVEGIDITDRRRSEEALRAFEARLRHLEADLERQVIERAQARSLTWK